MAKNVDEHWGGRLVGFRPPQKGPGDILTFSGLYVALYRIGSRAAHAQIQSLDVYGDFLHYPRKVYRPTTEVSIWWPIAVPLYAPSAPGLSRAAPLARSRQGAGDQQRDVRGLTIEANAAFQVTQDLVGTASRTDVA